MRKIKIEVTVPVWEITEEEANALHKLLGQFSQHFLEKSGLEEHEARLVMKVFGALDLEKRPLGAK